MTKLVTSGSVGGMASNGCFYPEVLPIVTGAFLWITPLQPSYFPVLAPLRGLQATLPVALKGVPPWTL
jgi:hypothetical protein